MSQSLQVTRMTMLHPAILVVILLLAGFSNAFVQPLGTTRTRFVVLPPTKHHFAVSTSRQAIDWFKKESFDSLLPKDDALAILDELLSNDELMKDSEDLISENWNKLESKLYNETRCLQEILGPDTTQQIVTSIERVEGYDPESVRAFLTSDAVNSLFAKILYDGIFEFFQRIDVFGNIVNSLPIIGPIRKQIVVETKRQLDRSLGPLVQSFLRTYTKIAVEQAADFVLSKENQKAFGGANVRLADNLLKRPLNTLLPPSDMSSKLKDDVFEYLNNANMTQVDKYLTFVYDIAGDKSVDDFVNVERVLDSSPTLQKTVDRFWDKVTSAGEQST